MRLSTGDLVEISDGEKYEYIAEIKDISKENVLLSIVDKKPFFTEPQMEINLYQSVPKGSKMEFVIQKTTELGINSIIPVLTERTIVQFKNDKDKKVERWKKIAEEASKQSKRGIIPQIINPMSFEDALEHCSENQINIIAYEKEESFGIKQLMNKFKDSNIEKVGIWIGPEGGFSDNEISLALKENLYSISLGPRILRTETAGLTVLSILMYELGDLGG